MEKWYVIATAQSNDMVELRIVAGPLTLDAAKEEATLRLARLRDGFKLSVVEFDPFYAFA